MKGKDPDAHRCEEKRGFIQGSAVIGVKMQAGVRIPESQTQGRSKIGVGENTNQSRYQEVKITFNMRKTKTNTHKGKRYWGEESQKRNKTTNRLKQVENTNTTLTDKHRNTGYKIYTGTGNRSQESSMNRSETRKPNTNDELAKNHRQVWTINTLGKETLYAGFWGMRRS